MAKRLAFLGVGWAGLFLLGAFLGLGGGAWMLNHTRALFAAPEASKTDALRSLLEGKETGASLCAGVKGTDLNGAFRELDCLVMFRRAFPKRGKKLSSLVLKKFRALHKRLKAESVDWRTVARWKFLYLLSTRLYPVRNKWAENAPIPVYQVNGHHLSVPFWIKESMRRRLGPLFHLDTHNDMRAVPSPTEVLEAVRKLKNDRDVKNSWHTIAHAIYDCAMPVAGGVLTAKYRNVIWGKPSWNGYPEFVNRPFFFGRPKSGVPVAVLPKDLKGEKRKKKAKEFKAWEKKRSHFRLYYDPKADKGAKIERQDAWVEIAKSQRPWKEKFSLFTPFTLTILTTDMDIDRHGKGEGGKNFQKLLKALPKGPFTLDLDLDYFASVDSTEQFKRKAGSDPDWDLDKFKKGRKTLEKNLKKFRHMLLALQAKGRTPSLITIADSTYMTFAFDSIGEGQSEYTPVEHSAFLGRRVREIFRDIYGKKIIGRGRTKPNIPPHLQLPNNVKNSKAPKSRRVATKNPTRPPSAGSIRRAKRQRERAFQRASEALRKVLSTPRRNTRMRVPRDH